MMPACSQTPLAPTATASRATSAQNSLRRNTFTRSIGPGTSASRRVALQAEGRLKLRGDRDDRLADSLEILTDHVARPAGLIAKANDGNPLGGEHAANLGFLAVITRSRQRACFKTHDDLLRRPFHPANGMLISLVYRSHVRLMAKRDYYDILGIPRTASADEIKKAHRKLVRKYHPDVNRDNPKSSDQFKEVQEAYDVLSDTTKRQNYDQFGHAGVDAGAGGGGGPDPFEAFRRAQQSGRKGGGRRATAEDFGFGGFGGNAGGGGGNADFSSIFEQMFGGGRGGGGQPGGRVPREQAPPGDIEHPVTLTFEQAARGVTLPLQINRDGRLETIDVKIPPGVKDGSRVRIKGRGRQSDNGDGGDLYIVTTIRPHAYYRREGLDILVDLPISLYEALLGTKVEVPTLEGPVTLTIPPGTNSGAKLRIKERGIFRGSDKGDQFVVMKVIVPKNLTADEVELVKKLQATHPVDARSELKW